jgi:hypothetical protein
MSIKWEVLPARFSEPDQPQIGFTDDNGQTFTIVCAVKSSARAQQMVDAMNVAERLEQARAELVGALRALIANAERGHVPGFQDVRAARAVAERGSFGGSP